MRSPRGGEAARRCDRDARVVPETARLAEIDGERPGAAAAGEADRGLHLAERPGGAWDDARDGAAALERPVPVQRRELRERSARARRSPPPLRERRERRLVLAR